MKSKLLALALLAGSTLSAFPRVFVGVGYARFPAPYYVAPPPPAPVVTYAPPYPGPGYSWVGGYWYPMGPRYVWHAGYWARPPYGRTSWVAPRYRGHLYHPGYWR